MSKSPNNKIVVIFSGGLDSTSLIWYLNSEKYEIVEAITFNYGQRHQKEVVQAKKIIEYFNSNFYTISHQVVDITNIGKLIAKGSLTDLSTEVPHDMYDAENQKSTIVPNRNMILLSIAAGRAITLKASNIGYAAHASDYSVYPDCRPEFIKQLNKALYEGNIWDPIELLAPFQLKSKSRIVELGIKLGVPFHLTWSCYEGDQRPCLQCGTCIERTEAFLNNNFPDPSLNKDEWKEAIKHYNTYSRK